MQREITALGSDGAATSNAWHTALWEIMRLGCSYYHHLCQRNTTAIMSGHLDGCPASEST